MAAAVEVAAASSARAGVAWRIVLEIRVANRPSTTRPVRPRRVLLRRWRNQTREHTAIRGAHTHVARPGDVDQDRSRLTVRASYRLDARSRTGGLRVLHHAAARIRSECRTAAKVDNEDVDTRVRRDQVEAVFVLTASCSRQGCRACGGSVLSVRVHVLHACRYVRERRAARPQHWCSDHGVGTRSPLPNDVSSSTYLLASQSLRSEPQPSYPTTGDGHPALAGCVTMTTVWISTRHRRSSRADVRNRAWRTRRHGSC